MTTSERLVEVFATSSIPEAEVVRSRLEDEGIPVMASGTDSPYRLGPVHLFVPADLQVQAELVLAEAAGGGWDGANDDRDDGPTEDEDAAWRPDRPSA